MKKSYITVQLKHYHNEQLPNLVDVYGAALGIVRLWCTYRYISNELHKNKVKEYENKATTK